MKVVIQRVLQASVTIDGQVYSAIKKGMMILVGIQADDTAEDIEWLSGKICNLRIFDDENGVMNKSIKEDGGEILAVSQFTLMARTKKGNRPISMPLIRIYLFLCMKNSCKNCAKKCKKKLNLAYSVPT